MTEYASTVSLVAAALLFCVKKSRRMWRYTEKGLLLPLIPALSPYLLFVAAVTAVTVISLVGAALCVLVILAVLISLAV